MHKTTLRLHNFYLPGRAESRLLARFSAQVGQLSDRLQVEIVDGNGLGLDDTTGLSWLSQGEPDLAVLWPVFLQRNNAELEASYPMGSARHLMDHHRAAPDLEVIGRRVLEEHGIVLLAFLPSPVLWISIFSSGKPVTSLDDLRGRRLRVFSKDLEPTFRRLGVDANFIPQGVLYSALEAGRFDCTVYPACQTSWSVPLWRVTQHAAYLFPEALHPYALSCSPQAWARLDDGQRCALREAAEGLYPEFLRLSIDNAAELAARRNLEAAGLAWHPDFSAPDRAAFAESAAQTWADLSDKAGGRAPDNFQRLMAAMHRRPER